MRPLETKLMSVARFWSTCNFEFLCACKERYSVITMLQQSTTLSQQQRNSQFEYISICATHLYTIHKHEITQ
jgi:hypothetical protein